MHAMQPLLAFNMDEAKAWSFLIVGSVAAIAAAVGTILNAIQNYRNSQKLDKNHEQNKEAKVAIDKTLKNTNGGMHKMVKEVSGLKEEVRSLKTQNTTLRHDATVKQDKEKLKRKTPTK